MKIETLPLDKITPYARNPRRNDHAVDAVAASIREFGFKVPLVIDAQGVIVTGHTRYKAAQKLGLTEAPCIRADDLTPEQVRAFRLADNKVGELADWDEDLLAGELEALPPELTEQLFAEMGFDRPSESRDLNDVEEDEPPERVESRVSAGETWLCGEHRIRCGSSADAADMAALMGADRAHFVFTDPPYGVAIGDKNKILNDLAGKGGRHEENIKNDNIKKEELYALLKNCFVNIREFARDDCSYYVSSPQGGDLGMMMMMMQEAGLPVRHILIWVKNIAVFSMGRLDYDYRHEPIFYTWTRRHNFYGGYDSTVIDDQAQLDKLTKAQLKEMVRAYQSGGRETSVIRCDKPVKSELHPTMKPVKLVARFMFNSSAPGDIVLDGFGGSGTTMIAAEQLGRRARLMEIDPQYCDVILTRWEQFTGRKAERLA